MRRFWLPAVALAMVVLVAGEAGAPRANGAAYMLETRMFGDQQVPPVTTIAWGFVLFYFNEDRSEADYTVDVKGMSSNLVQGADIHRGTRGTNGPAIRHLADGNFLVYGGHIKFSKADLDEMARGQWYVSLKSLTFPDGELRGQISLPDDFFPASSQVPVGGAATQPGGANPLPDAVATISPPTTQAPRDVPPPLGIGAPTAPVPTPGTLPSVPIRPPNTGDGGLLSSNK